eukprot:scaffold13697_cov69-Phaeocystis_antarctica.AAC.1
MIKRMRLDSDSAVPNRRAQTGELKQGRHSFNTAAHLASECGGSRRGARPARHAQMLPSRGVAGCITDVITAGRKRPSRPARQPPPVGPMKAYGHPPRAPATRTRWRSVGDRPAPTKTARNRPRQRGFRSSRKASFPRSSGSKGETTIFTTTASTRNNVGLSGSFEATPDDHPRETI